MLVLKLELLNYVYIYVCMYLKIIYHSFFHSILSYGIIFRENLSQSITIFQIQKRVITFIMGCRKRYSCRIVFKVLSIFPLKLQYIVSLIILIIIATSQLIQIIIIYLIDKEITCFFLKQIWPLFKKDLIIRESNF